jgi:hypothetical protein
MTGYTKLFGSIITSTIWREKNETRILWITMLALKNKHGIVEGSIPGLADMARLSIEDTIVGLETLKSPDQYSRTKEYGGRRIEEADGGWMVLGHGKWRAKMNEDERREYLTIKQREHRARVKNGQQKVDPSTLCTHTDTDTDTDTKKKEVATTKLRWSIAEGWSGLDEQLSLDFKAAFPAVNVKLQFQRMEQWLLANPKRAHKSNWRRFVNGWLTKSQDRGGDIPIEKYRHMGDPPGSFRDITGRLFRS